VFEELDENKPREQEPTNYTGLIIFACTVPVMLFFWHIGKFELGLNIGMSLAIAALAAGIYWKLRRRFWLWVILVSLFAMHLPLLVRIHRPNRWVPGIELLPIGLADLLIYIGVITLAKKVFIKGRSSNTEIGSENN
jgi:hypothetical protein